MITQKLIGWRKYKPAEPYERWYANHNDTQSAFRGISKPVYAEYRTTDRCAPDTRLL